MESQKPQAPSDEIDLKELAVRTILYLKRHFSFIAISTIVGILLSTVTYFFLPKLYESDMTVVSDLITEPYSKGVMQSLKHLIAERNHSAVASRLGVSEEIASSLQDIEIESKAFNPELSKRSQFRENEVEYTIFTITATVTDEALLPALQQGIIHMLSNSEFVKVRVRLRLETDQKLIDKIGLEIKSLDSLNARLLETKPIYSKNSGMLLLDASNINKEIIELSKEQMRYKNALELSDPVQLVEGFVAFEKPASPKLSILLIIGFLTGFILPIIYLAFSKLLRIANASVE